MLIKQLLSPDIRLISRFSSMMNNNYLNLIRINKRSLAIHRTIITDRKYNSNWILNNERLKKIIHPNKIIMARNFTSGQNLSNLPILFIISIGFFNCVFVFTFTEYLIKNYLQSKEW